MCLPGSLSAVARAAAPDLAALHPCDRIPVTRPAPDSMASMAAAGPHAAAAAASSGAVPQLMLACHRVEDATAKESGRQPRPTDSFHVPFSMILLLDLVKRKATPPHSKCRMVVPSDGRVSISLWDTADADALVQWLNENLGGDAVTELHEVQEDFTFGLSLELARVRAAEKVAGALGERTHRAAELVNTAVGTTQQRLEAWDQRTGVLSSAKETTAAIQARVVGAVSKAADNPRVQQVATNVTTHVASGWAKVSSWVSGGMQGRGAFDAQHSQHPGLAGEPGDFAPAAAGGGAGGFAAAPGSSYQPAQQPVGGGSGDRPLSFGDSLDDDFSLASPTHTPAAPTAAPAAAPPAAGPAPL